MKRLLFTSAVSLTALLFTAAPALAHPLGNFTTNVHLGIHVQAQEAAVLLVVDMAEIPAFRERSGIDTDGNGTLAGVELTEYADRKCAEHVEEIGLLQGRSAVALVSGGSEAAERAGQGGLTTLRLECRYRAAVDRAAPLEIHNRVYEDRLGWAEIVATGEMGGPDVLATSPSDELRSYPPGGRMDVREATLLSGGAVASPAGDPAGDDGEPGLITRLERAFAQAGTPAGAAVALASAIALGAGHALAPGHGKTLMAAYLVGRRGTARQAAGLGLAVAISHTLGVGILGVITTAASSAFQPDAVYPWLSGVSALVVTGLGLAMLWRVYRSRSHGRGHHGHGHDHDHDHHHDHDHTRRLPETGGSLGWKSLGWKSLAAIGLAGGLVPSASALVLLLGAVSIGRPLFGLALVAAFGVGMSAALVGAGLAALRLSEIGIRRLRGRAALGRRWIPVIGGLAVTSVGLVLLGGTLGRLA